MFILDVGHGNSAVLMDTRGNVVVDAGPRNALYLFLKREGIKKIDTMLISHADQDHIGGLIGIIASGEFIIGKIRVNSDALQRSKTWDDLLYTLSHAQEARQVDFDVSLSTKNTGEFDCGEVHIEILAPNLYIAGKSSGSHDREDRKLTTNSISAVMRMSKDGVPFALFLGDIDKTGLENLSANTKDVSAKLAVFPHHGGKPGRENDLVSFTKKVCKMVQPDIIVFSNGRGSHATPRKEIATTILKVLAKARIVCTQLSEHCAAELLIKEFPHLTSKFAQGRERGKCCAGSITIDLSKDKIVIQPSEKDHKVFIRKAAPTALCLGE